MIRRLFPEISFSPFSFLVDYWSALVVISYCGEEGRTRSRGQLLDNWIQLRQTEYLILPFRGERVRQDWGRGWQFNNSGWFFPHSTSYLSLNPIWWGWAASSILEFVICARRRWMIGGRVMVFLSPPNVLELSCLLYKQHLHHFVHGWVGYWKKSRVAEGYGSGKSVEIFYRVYPCTSGNLGIANVRVYPKCWVYPIFWVTHTPWFSKLSQLGSGIRNVGIVAT